MSYIYTHTDICIYYKIVVVNELDILSCIVDNWRMSHTLTIDKHSSVGSGYINEEDNK